MIKTVLCTEIVLDQSIMTWCIDTDSLVVLHAKPELVKKKYLTKQF